MAGTKRGLEGEWEDPAAKRAAHGTALLCMKLLFSDNESACITGQGQSGTVMDEIQTQTGAYLRLSGEGQHYPGTALQEMNIQGSSQQAVLGAAVHALSVISETLGSISSDGAEVLAGNAKVRCVVPAKAASGIIGPRGETVKQLRAQTGIQCSIDPNLIPPGGMDDLNEQALSLFGPLSEMHNALSAISARVSDLAGEIWFASWAERSNAGVFVSGLQLFADKGKGKGAVVAPDANFAHFSEGLDSGGLQGSSQVVAAAVSSGPALITLKLLVDHSEAAHIRVADVEQSTGTQVSLSGSDSLYPGTNLQELKIQAASETNVIDGVVACFEQIAENTGTISCGETGVEPGGARAKVVVPAIAAKAVIGVKGATVASIRVQSKMHVHIEASCVPPGPPADTSEQIVSINGPLDGLPVALSLISAQVSQYSAEPWYAMWVNTSHVGMVFPGLVFFQDDGKGKGKGKKGDGKGFEKGFDGKGFAPQWSPQAPQSTWAAPPPKAAQRGTMALKLLLPATEASAVLGKGGATIREIGQNTFTKLSLSGISEFFPGTNLQELRIRGSNPDQVLAAIMQVLNQISQSLGVIANGALDVPVGEARVKVVIPAAAAKVVIGRAGANIKDMRAQSGMHVHVEETVIPPGPPTDLSEQVVCLSGRFEGLQAALPLIAGHVGEVINEPWFPTWCMSSNAGTFFPGLQLFQNVKGGSKGKGKPEAVGHGGGFDGGKGFDAGSKGLYGPAAVPSFPGGKGYAPPANKARGSNISVKLLFTEAEANSIYGDGSSLNELQAATYTHMRMSETTYPGSDLYELSISGANEEAVLAALLQVLDRVMELVGSVTAGEGGVQSGAAALKLVVPAKAAAAVIGPGGQTVKQLREQSGVRLSVDTNPVPCIPEMAEQAVLVMGSFSAVNLALSTVLQQVAEVSGEPWFDTWASSSNAGVHIPGFQLFAKGKGKSADGKSKDSGFGKDSFGKGKGFGKDSGFGKGDGYGPAKGYEKGYGAGDGYFGPAKGYDKGYEKGYDKGYGAGNGYFGPGKSPGKGFEKGYGAGVYGY